MISKLLSNAKHKKNNTKNPSKKNKSLQKPLKNDDKAIDTWFSSLQLQDCESVREKLLRKEIYDPELLRHADSTTLCSIGISIGAALKLIDAAKKYLDAKERDKIDQDEKNEILNNVIMTSSTAAADTKSIKNGSSAKKTKDNSDKHRKEDAQNIDMEANKNKNAKSHKISSPLSVSTDSSTLSANKRQAAYIDLNSTDVVVIYDPTHYGHDDETMTKDISQLKREYLYEVIDRNNEHFFVRKTKDGRTKGISLNDIPRILNSPQDIDGKKVRLRISYAEQHGNRYKHKVGNNIIFRCIYPDRYYKREAQKNPCLPSAANNFAAIFQKITKRAHNEVSFSAELDSVNRVALLGSEKSEINYVANHETPNQKQEDTDEKQEPRKSLFQNIIDTLQHTVQQVNIAAHETQVNEYGNITKSKITEFGNDNEYNEEVQNNKEHDEDIDNEEDEDDDKYYYAGVEYNKDMAMAIADATSLDDKDEENGNLITNEIEMIEYNSSPLAVFTDKNVQHDDKPFHEKQTWINTKKRKVQKPSQFDKKMAKYRK